MQKFRRGWYVIYTKPHFEKKLCVQLAGKIPDLFLPMIKTRRIYGKKKLKVEKPLFPSYVFVFLEDFQNFYAGMRAEGFLNYLRSGDTIATVGDEIIHSIRVCIRQERDTEISSDQFMPGQAILINSGALQGVRGEIVKMNGNNKLLVRVNLLRRNLLMTLTSEFLASNGLHRYA